MGLKKLSWFVFFSVIFTTAASAHSISEVGLSHGFWHPLLGLDHLLAALAVGLLASQSSHSKWIIPSTFIIGMILGSVLGFLNLKFPFVEAGILMSIFVMGIALTMQSSLSLKKCIPFLLFFGFFHGHAHGMELKEMESALFTLLGLVLSTSLIHGAGLGAVNLLKKNLKNHSVKTLVRITGAGLTGLAVILYSQVL